MDKDNSQESMISSNSLSFGKNRGEAYYSSNPTFYVGIDCIIFGFNEGEISLLLLKRNFEPAMGEWSLMGGFVKTMKVWMMPPNVYCMSLPDWKTFTWNR